MHADLVWAEGTVLDRPRLQSRFEGRAITSAEGGHLFCIAVANSFCGKPCASPWATTPAATFGGGVF